MSKDTEQVMQMIKSHSRIKKILTFLSYILIIGGIITYIFHAFNTNNAVKVVSKYKKNRKKYQVEKIMTNPRINFQYNENEIYRVQAKRAFHKSEEEAILYEVNADGPLGIITAGQLTIYQEGDHLVFSDNPVLILNKTNQ